MPRLTPTRRRLNLQKDPPQKPKRQVNPTSPAVRKLAAETGTDPDAISGTGKGGRITKADVIESARDTPATEPAETVTPSDSSAKQAAPEAPDSVDGERVTRKPLSPIRRKIASRLVEAQQTAAILTTFNEADMSAVIDLRKNLQDQFVERHGIKLGFMSFFVKAAVHALKAVPEVNVRLEGEHLVRNHYHDISVAIGTEKGLFVPVVRDCV